MAKKKKTNNFFFALFIILLLLSPVIYYLYKEFDWESLKSNEQKIETILKNQEIIISKAKNVKTAKQSSIVIINFVKELKKYKQLLKKIEIDNNARDLKQAKDKISSNILLFVDTKAMEDFTKDEFVQKATDELIENMWFLKNK